MSYIQSEPHLVNHLKKTMRSIDANISIEDMTPYISEFFLVSKKIEKFTARSPIDTLSWHTSQTTTEDEFVSVFELIYNEVMILESNQVYDFQYLSIKKIVKIYSTKDFKGGEGVYTIEFTKLCYSYLGTPGVYFLFDSNEKLIYIGKSKDVSSRINTSIAERRATGAYILATKTEADAHVLESYFIATMNPLLNSEGKCEDDVTFTIDIDLNIEITKIWRDE